MTLDPPPQAEARQVPDLQGHDAAAGEAQARARSSTCYTPRQREPYTKGRAYLYFFPDGHTERAIVRLNDGDDFYSLVVHPLTGRVEVHVGQGRHPARLRRPRREKAER